MKKYRTFNQDFKKQLIAEIESGTVTLSQAARTHQIAPSLIGRWKNQIISGTFREKLSAKEKELEKEVDYYKKKVGELTRTVDLLKKLDGDLRAMRRSNGFVVTAKNMGQLKQAAK